MSATAADQEKQGSETTNRLRYCYASPYVAKHRRNKRETFIPLAHDPGQRIECDFGHIYVDFPDGRRQVPVLIVVWAYSNYPFAMAMPSERTEAILAGMVETFEFFDCLPQEVWWDNPRTVVTKIFKGRQRQPNDRYAALASHYAFDPMFCLPASGNEKLRALTQAQEQYEQQCQADRVVLDEQSKARILSLAADFPRLWRDPQTPDRERKRMVRLLIEDVTLIKAKQITAHVRFKGGTTQRLTLPIPLSAGEARRTGDDVIGEIDRMLDHHTDAQIASRLNQRSLRSGTGGAFTPRIVSRIRRNHRLKSHRDRLRGAGMLSLAEIAEQLSVTSGTINTWRDHGLLRAHVYNSKRECLYQPVNGSGPVKSQGQKLSKRRRFSEVPPNRTHEVQHAT